MSSKIIKFVAGGGKTTYAKKIIKERNNGIYLAFNNSVVEEIAREGYLSSTIDSFIQSFIIPKFTLLIPAISQPTRINYKEIKNDWENGINSISFDAFGKILYCGNETGLTLFMTNKEIQKLHCKYSKFVKQIFKKDSLELTHSLRSSLGYYIISNYSKELVSIIKSRFDYVIFDEAQDLNGTRELLAKTLFENGVETCILGDENQNINNGGEWFENLIATETQKISYRSPKNICNWIRNELEIEIYANGENDGNVIPINYDDIKKYDDGNRVLLYFSKTGKYSIVIDDWLGKKSTIRSVKGKTIKEDIVIIGDTLNTKLYYTALTRTTSNAYTTIKSINKRG